MGGRPLFILSEDAQRTTGRDAQASNITAGKAVAQAVRTTLGPRGMDKMLVSDAGDIVITNDGATILDEMDIEHPAAQMIVEVAETQEDEVGDGTTTAAILAGQLLTEAEDLLQQDVHATTIVEGYYEAARIARETIEDHVIEAEVDESLLRRVAASSMTGKGTGGLTADRLSETVVDAVRSVDDDDDDAITIESRVGASTTATELVDGVILDEGPAHDDMPWGVEDATVAVLDFDLEVRTGELDVEYAVESVEELTAAMDSEAAELRGYAQALSDAGVDVVVTTGDVDERVLEHLVDAEIVAFDDVSDAEARRIGRASGARWIGTIDDIEADDLGHFGSVSVRQFGDDELTFFEGGEAAESVTILVRGGTENVVTELERVIEDSIDVVRTTRETGEVVPGAGSSEIAIASAIREAAAGITGRRQLAVEAFADAVDTVPRTIAENAGEDPIDAIVDLRAMHDETGRAGIVVDGGEVRYEDPVDHGVLDPAAVKHEAIESATEAATMIVRIDDVIAAS
ncbi:MAG: thermosome subunit alpha [Halobacteriota archaeon]